MTFASRHICLAVLLGLLVSHASIAVHAATHVSGDSADCELCLSYGDSPGVVATAHEQRLPDGRGQQLSDPLVSSLDTRQVVSFRPRGPPSSA